MNTHCTSRGSLQAGYRVALCLVLGTVFASVAAPTYQFHATQPAEAEAWQKQARAKLFELMMGGSPPARVALEPVVVRRVEVAEDQCVLEEVRIRSLPDREAHLWVARPLQPDGKVGAVLAIHGHGGSGEQIVRGSGLYWYGRELIRLGYVVVAPDVGQHHLQHTNWTLMGERTWDAIRALDYAVTLPEVDPERLAVAGLSLGGETTMYVAAMDTRLRIACSSGWLTTVANMKNGHCECFNFPGLEEHFDFSDIFACVAPRSLVCELGEQERAPGGFPVNIGRPAFEKIRAAYRVFDAENRAQLSIHPGPHVFFGEDFWPRLRQELGSLGPPLPNDTAAVAWARFQDGPESFEGVPYRWLGNAQLRLEFDVAPTPGDALEIRWGAKGDERTALLVINNHTVPLQASGHWGFRWLRVPVPVSARGEQYVIEVKRATGRPAFLSEVRLVSARQGQAPSDLKAPQHRAKLTLVGATEAPSTPAFPEMEAAWNTPSPVPLALAEDLRQAILFKQAEQNGRLANQAFYRCRRFIDGWLSHADPDTGLIPRNLNQSRDFWNGRDSAADNYPYMVLTAAMTDRPLLNCRLLEMLRTETRLTSRVGRLPDDYSFSKKGWRREQVDLEALIFEGAEYVKDGLLPITEWLGCSPWSERMIGIIDDVWANARVETTFGVIPTRNFEVSGDLLQACSRLFWFTGERKYLDWATRLGDYYLLGTNHPTRDLDQLRLIDHGCEVVNGLSELYFAVAQTLPAKKTAYEKPIHELFDVILQKGRNEHGLLYSWFNPKTGAHSQDLCDTWGYVYDGFYTLWLLDKKPAYHEAVLKALGNLKGNYVGACWGEKNADAYADSIEGAINLLNREPVRSAADWIDSQIQMMWAIQKPDGIIEGWHGDGNFARTSLMYALWKTQGVTVEPWRPDVRLGAVRDGDALQLCVSSTEPWEGRLVFDQPRHELKMRLPLDYPRINQFPEWFAVEPTRSYQVNSEGQGTQVHTGGELANGWKLQLTAGDSVWISVRGE